MTTKRIFAQKLIEVESEEVNILTNPDTRATANGYTLLTSDDGGNGLIPITGPLSYAELTTLPLVFTDGSYGVGGDVVVSGGVCTFLAGTYQIQLGIQMGNTGNSYLQFDAPTLFLGAVSSAGPIPITGVADERAWNISLIFPTANVCNFNIRSVSVDGINPCTIALASLQFIRIPQ